MSGISNVSNPNFIIPEDDSSSTEDEEHKIALHVAGILLDMMRSEEPVSGSENPTEPSFGNRNITQDSPIVEKCEYETILMDLSKSGPIHPVSFNITRFFDNSTQTQNPSPFKRKDP